MAYPPPIPPATRANQTPQADNHPADHNMISGALSDIVNVLGPNPQGASGNVAQRVQAIDSTLPLIQYGLWNGNTDGNAYARITWPLAYPGIPAAGDVGNRADCGVLCMPARGAGNILVLQPMFYALGGFNAGNAIVRCFQFFSGAFQPYASQYCVFHFMVWGPRYSGQFSAGVVP